MPAFSAASATMRPLDFPPQYLEPKFESTAYQGYVPDLYDSEALYSDPYNHNKYPRRNHVHFSPPTHPRRDEAVGGISANLDYDMDTMAEFVVCSTVAIVKPLAHDGVLFRKWVLQVLNATRLPSATIVLSLSYLALRVRALLSVAQHVPTERGLYQMLTVALILASKFNDDNTFQNKSWAEVSNISVGEINHDELDWLLAFGHRLHHDPNVADGYTCWQAKWDVYRHGSRPLNGFTLPPLEMSRRPAPLMRDYGHGYDMYYDSRSPSTVTHSGPTTPEYLDLRARWGPTDFSDLMLHAPAPYASQYAYTPQYMYHKQDSLESNCHGRACQCYICRQPNEPRWDHIMVA